VSTGTVALVTAEHVCGVEVVLRTRRGDGGGLGAQCGDRAGAKLKGEQLRVLLSMMLLCVCIKIGLDLTLTPNDLYALGATGGH